jgi:hypothetical protein
MARPLLISNPENATIEELKLVSRIESNETATRCPVIQMLLAGADRQLVCNALNEEKLLERLDQDILDVINNPKKTQKTACIGMLI